MATCIRHVERVAFHGRDQMAVGRCASTMDDLPSVTSIAILDMCVFLEVRSL